MTVKKTLIKLTLVIMGCVLGFLAVESAMYIHLGNARECLFKEANAYYDYEVYCKYFKKINDKNGKLVYMSQRSRCNSEYFAVEKSSNTKRIFTIGESAAGIFVSHKEYLKVALEKTVKGHNFEVIDCATPAYDISRIRLIMDEIIGYKPDMLLFFMGNNNHPLLKENGLLKSSYFRYFYERSWLLRRLYGNRGSIQADNYNKVFKNNYEQMISIAKAHNIPAALFMLPVNYSDYPPKVNMQDYSSKGYFMACFNMVNGEYKKAVNLLNILKNKSGFDKNPFVHFSLGKCYENMNDILKAKQNYLQSLDLDTFGNRCDSIRSEIVRELAVRNKCILVDIPKIFEKVSKKHLIGDELFTDHCHWFFSYNALIINELLQQAYLYNKTNSTSLLGISAMPEDSINLEKIVNDARKQENSLLIKKFLYNAAVDSYDDFNFEDAIYNLKRVYKNNADIVINISSYKNDIYKEIQSNGFVDVKEKYSFNANWYKVLLCAGEACRRSGDNKAALQLFDKSIQENNKQVYSYLFRGLTYYQLKDMKHAAADWKIVMDREPAFSWLTELLH